MRKFLFLALFLLALPAHAISIVNLDKEPHVVIVNNGGEEIRVELQPNQIYRTFGPMVDIGVQGIGNMRRAETFADYAIWGGGRLVLQMRRDPDRR